MMVIGLTSCKKDVGCSCGEIVEIYKNEVDGSNTGYDFIQLKGKTKVSVRNHCSGDIKDFKDTDIKYNNDVVGNEWCNPKERKW